jgi:NADPH:quinone reductase-like Zn-dependent oxidoreductase
MAIGGQDDKHPHGQHGTEPCSVHDVAWRVHEFGPPEATIFETAPRPDPGPGEVLVRVHAAGVGPWDGWIRAGKSALLQPLPLTLGSDLSGEVAALGSGISGLAVGDQVFGVTNPQFVGAYAEYALASAGMLAKKPSALSYIEAASVPVIAVTAWQGLFKRRSLRGSARSSCSPALHRDGGNQRYRLRSGPRCGQGDGLSHATLRR